MRQELILWDGILPFIYRNLKATWCSSLSAVDASEYGLGMCVAPCSHDLARHLGGVCERWRFHEELGVKPRDVAFLSSGEAFLPEGDIYEKAEPRHGKFPAVTFDVVDRAWKTVGCHRWRRGLTLPVGEARACLYAAKHTLRNIQNFGMRHVILSDSMTATWLYPGGGPVSLDFVGCVNSLAPSV